MEPARHSSQIALVSPISSSGTTNYISDQEVFAACPDAHEFPNLPPAVVLYVLYNIVKLSHQRAGISVDPAAGIASAYIKHNPAVGKLVIEAWRKRSFREIWDLPGLCAPSRRKPDIAIDPQRKATEEAWKVDYVGENHHLVLNIVDEMQTTRAEADYANTVPIIQSSGTGKSRTVHEVAKLVFTLPFNIREGNTSGFPDPDSSIRNFLVTEKPSDIVRVRYLHFLTTVFDKVALVIDQMLPAEENLASGWHAYLEAPSIGDPAENNRRALYIDAVEVARSLERSGDEVWATPEERRARSAEKLREAKVKAREAARNLVSKVSPRQAGVHVLLYFDEARPLMTRAWDRELTTDRHTFYNHLCWSLNVLKASPIFTIFLSTYSHLSSFAPSASHHQSDRGSLPRAILQPPITEMPFDCFHNGQPFAIPEELSLESVSEFDFMVKFGRPLFWTRWKVGGPTIHKGIIDFARAKLTRRDRGDNDLSESALYAILSTRILMDFEPRGETTAMEEELIEGHMRIAYSIPKHRGYIRSGSSSEPILAEAAAHVMDDWSRAHQSQPFGLIEALAKFSQNGLITHGERGELVARLLLTLAYDRAANRNTDLCFVENFSKPILLTEFLRALFTEPWAQVVLDSRPDNQIHGASLRQAFKHAYVRFTHFVKADNECAATTHGASAGIIRGFAFQCIDRKESIDIIIPVVLCKKDTTEIGLGEDAMTGILISIKNRGTSISSNGGTIDAVNLGFFPSDGLPARNPRPCRPYITIAMELGHESGSELAFPEEVVIPQPLVVQPRRKKQVATLGQDHPRYSFSVSGCSPTIYEGVHEPLFAQLLGLREEHPQQSREYLAAVRRITPSVAIGPSSFGWVENDFLSKPVNPRGNELLVGGAEDESEGHPEDTETNEGDTESG